MPTQVQTRRGTTAEHSTFTGAVGEVTVDTDKEVVVVHDGTTAGGYPQMRENGSQSLVTTGSITGGRFIPTSSTVPTNGLYLPSANSVALSTNGTGRLFVDAAGNVGIGTTPTLPLDISASNSVQIKLARPTGVDMRLNAYYANSDLASLSVVSAHPLAFHTNNTERLRITSAGLVGIGTSSPGSKLTVAGSQLQLEINKDDGTADNKRWLFSTGSGSLNVQCLTDAGAGGGNLFRFNRSNEQVQSLQGFRDGAAWFHVDNSTARVGIGTTSPQALLDARQSSAGAIAYYSFAGSSGGGAAINVANGFSSTVPIYSFWFDSTTGLGNPSAQNLNFIINGTERARIDSSGRLLVGTSSARSTVSAGTATPSLQLEGTTFSASVLSIVRNESSGSGAALVLGRSNGTTTGSNTAISDGNGIGFLSFQGADGTNLIEAARISAFADGGVSTNDMPGRLVFSTTADGASSPTERMRISSTGAVTCTSTISDVAGNVRDIPQNAKTAAYTLVASDSGKHIDITTGGVTVPSGVFSVGNVITIFNDSTSSQTITQGASVTLRQAGTTNTGNRTLASYGLATLLCVSSNVFVISGAGLS